MLDPLFVFVQDFYRFDSFDLVNLLSTGTVTHVVALVNLDHLSENLLVGM
jgi:hypothetical protein